MSKRPSYKKRSIALEKALAEMDISMARMKGLLGTFLAIFGEEVMLPIRYYYDEPTEENKQKIQEALSKWISESKQEE